LPEPVYSAYRADPRQATASTSAFGSFSRVPRAGRQPVYFVYRTHRVAGNRKAPTTLRFSLTQLPLAGILPRINPAPPRAARTTMNRGVLWSAWL
jgi:hypothetical protein